MHQKKTAGKVVKVRKPRRTIPINPKLIAAIILAAAVVASVYGLSLIYRGSVTAPQTLGPYEIIGKLYEGDNIVAILAYQVSGNLDAGGKVLGVYDRLVFLVQPGTMQVPPEEEGGENITIRYYVVRYDTEHYLSNYLLDKLGTASLVSNLSSIIVDEETLKLIYENVSISELGRERRNTPLGDVEIRKYRIEVDDAVITVSREAVYKLPVEVTYSRNGNEVRMTLTDVIKY